MKNNIKSAVGLTSYFFSLPPAHVVVLAMLVIACLFGLALNFWKYSGIDLLRQGAMDGAILLAMPALLTCAVIKLMIRKMPFRRIAAVALAGEAIYGLAYMGSFLLVGVNALMSELILLLGAALVFILWYAIARLVFILKYRSVLFAIIQLLFYLVFLANSHIFVFGTDSLAYVAKFYMASFVLFGALYIFFLIINAPMKKSFGFSSTDAFTFFISQWLYHNKDLEKALESVGARVRTLVTVMGFQREKGNVYFATPLVHFGPFGNLGGSEFSYLIADGLEKKHGGKAFVFHGTVTHDLNPVSASQLDSILSACDGCIAETPFRDARVSLLKGKEAECRAEGFRINDSAFIGLSRAPYVTEDINFGLGLSLMKEAEKRVEVAMVVDQHNAETGDITSFEPGDIVGYNYMKAVENALAKDAKKGNALKIGVSCRSFDSSHVGKAGIKIAVLSSSPEYVLVLIDSNGVTPEYRDTIEAKVKEVGRKLGRDWEVGICTTDTHQTNVVRGVLNPLKEEDHMMAEIASGVEEAAKDMASAKFFAAKRWFDVDVIGAKQSIEIVSTVNSIVAVAKITLPLILIGAMLLLLAILTKI